MKTEILASIETIQTDVNELRDLARQLPNDPAPQPPTLTDLRVVNTIAGNLNLAWSPTAGTPFTSLLEVKGADSNPNGPQEWTPLPYNQAPPDQDGIMFAYVIQNPNGQVLLFRVRAMNSEGACGDPCEITVNVDDCLPA